MIIPRLTDLVGRQPVSPSLRAGTGDPLFECSAYSATYISGVPELWRCSDNDSFITRGTRLSAEDPPIYESSAAFLQRHQLFLPGEKRRVPKRDFEPNYVRECGESIVICRS
jgi:hypothetical protein